MNLRERENLSSTLRCTYFPNLCSYKGPAAAPLTNKDMSVRLGRPSRSSVISAGSKPSPETHVALMVRGQQQKKGLVAFYNMGYFCWMRVLVTGGGCGGGGRSGRVGTATICTQRQRELRKKHFLIAVSDASGRYYRVKMQLEDWT